MRSPLAIPPIPKTPLTCSRQKNVRELLRLGHWPEACPGELQSHVASCRICGDLVLVSTEVGKARAEAIHAAAFAAPGLVSPSMLWWRAQLRRRQQAVEKLGKPILGAQVFALAINAAIVISLGLWRLKDGHMGIGSKGLILSRLAKSPDVSRTGAFHLQALWSGWSSSSGSSNSYSASDLSAGTVWNWSNLASWMTSVTTATSWTTLIPCIATLAILSGVVLYLATEKQ